MEMKYIMLCTVCLTLVTSQAAGLWFGDSSEEEDPAITQAANAECANGYVYRFTARRDCPFHDIGDYNIEPTQESCTRRCDQTPGCVAVVYYPSSNRCWLKSECTNIVLNLFAQIFTKTQQCKATMAVRHGVPMTTTTTGTATPSSTTHTQTTTTRQVLKSSAQCKFRIQSSSYEDNVVNRWESYVTLNDHTFKSSSFREGNIGTGIFVTVINPTTFEIKKQKTFATYASDQGDDNFINFIDTVEPGSLILLATADEFTVQLGDNAEQLLKYMGAPDVDYTSFEAFRSSLALATYKRTDGTFSRINSEYNLRGQGPTIIDYYGPCYKLYGDHL